MLDIFQHQTAWCGVILCNFIWEVQSLKVGRETATLTEGFVVFLSIASALNPFLFTTIPLDGYLIWPTDSVAK
jgi:uncharacterized protein with PQ loop repeat